MNDDLYEPEVDPSEYRDMHPAPEDSPFGCLVMLLLLGISVSALAALGVLIAEPPQSQTLKQEPRNRFHQTIINGAL